MADLVVEIYRITDVVAEAYLWLQVENAQVFDHRVALVYHVDQQFVLLLLSILLLLSGSRVDDVGEEVADLWVDWLRGLPLENRADALSVLVTQPRHQDRVQPVQVAGEVPEASLATEPAVNQHIEAVDSKQRRVPLAAWEYVEGGMAESDVSNNV